MKKNTTINKAKISKKLNLKLKSQSLNNNFTLKIFITIFSVLLFILIILSSINFVIFDKKFYEIEFEKNNVYDLFGKNVTLSERDTLLNYFQIKDKLINSTFYNQKEKAHLADVKNLILLSSTLFFLSFIAIIMIIIYLFIKKKNEFLKIISLSFIISSTSVLALFLFGFIFQNNFSTIFYNFHLLLFSNNFWLLDPKTDNLINLFPEQFFFDASKKIFLFAVSSAILFLCSGYILRKVNKKKQAFISQLK